MVPSESAHSSSRQPVRRGALPTGFRLARASWATLRSDPELLWAPFVALLISAAAIVLDVVLWGGFHEAFEGPTLLVVLKLWPLLVVLHLVGVIADAVVVGAARIRLAGGDPNLHQGWAIAIRRLHLLVAYALLRAIERTLTLALSAFRQ